MKKLKPFAVSLLLIYFITAFIKWDLLWLTEIPSWAMIDRGISLFILLIVTSYAYFINYKLED